LKAKIRQAIDQARRVYEIEVGEPVEKKKWSKDSQDPKPEPQKEEVKYGDILADAVATCRRTKRSKETVYFVRSCGFIKIGYSRSGVERRLSTFETCSPHKYEIAGTVPGGRALESYLQGLFWDYHHKLEWFKEAGALKEFVTTLRGSVQKRKRSKKRAPVDPDYIPKKIAWAEKMILDGAAERTGLLAQL